MAATDTALRAVKSFRTRELALLANKVAPAQQAGPLQIHNPFLPRKNPETGRWAPPRYSLRRQAELVKKARASNTLHLLPPGPKLSLKQLRQACFAASTAPTPSPTPSTSTSVLNTLAAKGAPNADESKPEASHAASKEEWNERVKWVGKVPEKKDSGARLYAHKKRMFKGHRWQRLQKKREERRVLLMRDMEKRIVRFKSHYRKRKPNPLAVPRNTLNSKLPF